MVYYPTNNSTRSVIKFTNCRLARGDSLVKADLWISPDTGKIVRSQDVFFDSKLGPSRTIDLGGKIVCPGFIETQINGAFGFDFSADLDDSSQYVKGVMKIRRDIVKFGVTSLLPTITSHRPELYKKVRTLTP
jgi:N-acetylglucosamine-6-phosphate deacetylase